MAMYYCDCCGDLKDDDWNPCNDIKGLGDMVCEDCVVENTDEDGNILEEA